MSTTLTLALVCYGLGALALLLFGALYLFRPQFMPYHAEAVGKSWSELDARWQALLLGFLKISGGGFIASAVALGFMLAFPFRQGEAWARWAVPAVGLISALTSLAGTLIVQRNTPAKPPTGVVVGGVLLFVVGFVLSLL